MNEELPYETLLTRKQAAAMLNISVPYFIELENRGKIPRVELSIVGGKKTGRHTLSPLIPPSLH